MQAKLPINLEEVGLKDLEEGQTVYTVPWAMFAGTDRALWLNGDYFMTAQAQGTSMMRVIKKDGRYIVDVSKCRDYTWSLGGAQYVGGFVPLPVSELTGG